MWAAFFWKTGLLASFGDGWYFASVSHTTLGYGDVVLPKPWRPDLRDQRTAYLRMHDGLSFPGAAKHLATPVVTRMSFLV